MSVKKFLGQKNFWGKKILSQKNFGLIDLNPKFVLSKEKTHRVNPRWRIYADMEKVCFLPRPILRIYNNFRKISNKKSTI